MSTPDENKLGAAEQTPFAVYQISQLIGDYLGRLGMAWIEGQVSDVRKTRALTYLQLRDTERDVSISMHMSTDAFEQITPALDQGTRVVAQTKIAWWPKNGSLNFKVHQIRAVGLGELMARLEALRNLLAAEGLFNEDRKKPIPFLPRRVGLICGQNSDAMHDVVKNAKRRWPDVEFVIREVPVQGVTAVRKISDALTELDAIDDIDVIVVTRGGGSFEDLMTFSDESLIRVVAACDTPIVAAIGHEQDRPLIDYVADYRASTPTDAARKIVPDVLQEISDLRNARATMIHLVTTRVTYLENDLARLRARPALAHPSVLIDQRLVSNTNVRNAIRQRLESFLDLNDAHIRGSATTLRALSPQGTLERGYSIVRDSHGSIIRSAQNLARGQVVSVRVADGDFNAQVQD